MEITDLNTGYPGHIYNFNPVTQRGEVQLAIESLFTGYAKAYSLETKPRLPDVQIQFIQGGQWSLTHPVPDGTPCYVHFSQRGIEHWKEENKDVAGVNEDGLPNPSLLRKFNINDCVAQIGYQPLPETISGFSPDVMELRNADRGQRITLNGGGSIEIITGAAKITITKDSEIVVEVTSKATVKAPQILLDGDTTVTKSLTVQGGMAVSGTVGGATSTITGDFKIVGNTDQTGTLTLGGVVVNGHDHTNPEGGNVGPMQ